MASAAASRRLFDMTMASRGKIWSHGMSSLNRRIAAASPLLRKDKWQDFASVFRSMYHAAHSKQSVFYQSNWIVNDSLKVCTGFEFKPSTSAQDRFKIMDMALCNLLIKKW